MAEALMQMYQTMTAVEQQELYDFALFILSKKENNKTNPLDEFCGVINDEDAAVMMGKGSREISTSELGDLVLEKLYSVDKVAYIRFASVYREFKEVENFNAEVAKIKPVAKKK